MKHVDDKIKVQIAKRILSKTIIKAAKGDIQPWCTEPVFKGIVRTLAILRLENTK